MKKEIIIGFLIGVFANITGVILYTYFFIEYELDAAIRIAIENGTIGNIIALGAILNLFAFFILIKKRQMLRAKGVLMATILAALLVLISQF
jgi:hypothetical protein